MLRKKHASNVKLQNSINNLLIRMRKSFSLPVRNFKENQIASTKDQPKKEMNEDEKMRKLREVVEAVDEPVIIDRNM